MSRISNSSVSAIVGGYAFAPLEANNNVLVWLDLVPSHPKVLGAIWASLVNWTKADLRLHDSDRNQTYSVAGLRHRYIRKTVDAPQIAGRARPKFLRLLAPEARQIDATWLKQTLPFYVLGWRWKDASGAEQHMSPATALAAMLEQGAAYPIQMGWGEYLLAEAIARKCAGPLITSGSAPNGYWIKPAPWEEIISEGIRKKRITLDGRSRLTRSAKQRIATQPTAA